MSAEIINLRNARKAKSRANKEAKAASNRAAFGRTKAQRLNHEREQSRRKNELAGKEMSSDTEEDNSQ